MIKKNINKLISVLIKFKKKTCKVNITKELLQIIYAIHFLIYLSHSFAIGHHITSN